ncbi:unnamed protein product [Sphagnum balticum]
MFEKVPENMGLPKVRKYYQVNGKIASLEPSILTLKNGDEFLYKEPYGSGTIYQSDTRPERPDQKSGFYKVSLENSDSTDVIAMNYDRQESDLDFFKTDELKSRYNGANMTVVNSVGLEVAQVIKEMDRGISLWKACLIMALLALAAESLLLRFWRR